MSKRDISIGAGLRKFMITAGGKYDEIKILDKRKPPPFLTGALETVGESSG